MSESNIHVANIAYESWACMKARILVLTNNAGGLYSFRAELLEAFVRRGYCVFFCVPEKDDDIWVRRLQELGCVHIHAPMNRRGVNPFDDIKLVRWYKRVIDETVPDVILTYTVKPNVYGSYVSASARVPIILNVTGLGSSLQSGKLSVLVKWMYKYACRQASVVFFQNTANRDWFLANRLVEPGKIRLVPGSGVNLEKFRPVEKTSRDDKVRFLLIGRIMRDKGIEEYLGAAEEIRRRYPRTEFQIVGPYEDETYYPRIEDSDAVRYLGFSEDVREQIREADCIVHPSYHEGMSNVLLEAAAMGKPLLASNIPGCREIIDHGENGFLFEPRSIKDLVEKLEMFLGLDRSEWVRMGLKAREKVEREFDRNIVVNAYLQAIEDVIDGM